MTTHGFCRASHHIEHATSQEGEWGPVGLRVPSEGEGAHARQHTRVYTWGKGEAQG